MLADKFDEKKHVCTNWLVSEKLDGDRAYWSSTEKKLYSRNGNERFAPKWFIENMPDFDLDGELYFGRQSFEKMGIVRRKTPVDDDWKQIKYMVFDAPMIPDIFSKRLEYIRNNLKKSEYVQLVEMWPFTTIEKLYEDLDICEKKGGEGLMLKNDKCMYERKRSSNLLKLKSSSDTEVKIIGYKEGKGRNKDVVGSFEVSGIFDGKEKTFNVGTGLNDNIRKNPPAIGTIITIKYNDVTKNGIPRFPCFVRVREE